LARFLIKAFGPEAIVFDIASGDTHALSPLALALYSICLEQPGIALAEMHASAVACFDLATDEISFANTQDALTHLRRIGLLSTP